MGKHSKEDKSNPKKDFDKDSAIFNPAAFFKSPIEIIKEKRLTDKEKAKALKNWELDIRLNDIAVEENMPSFLNPRKNSVALEDVHLALEQLGLFPGEHGPTSKLGM